MVQEIADEFIQPDPAVVIGIEQVKINANEYATPHTAASDAKVHFRRRPEAAIERDFGRIIPAAGIGRISRVIAYVQSVCQQQRILKAGMGKVSEAFSVVTECKVNRQVRFEVDGNAKRPKD